MARVLGVLGGRDFPDELLGPWLAEADLIVAADSGADRCLALGFPSIVVGDLDSFRGPRDGLEIVADPDQHSTDCDKLLRYVESQGHRAVAIACLEGDRLDHVLASLNSLSRAPTLEVVVAWRRGLAYRLGPGDLIKSVPPAGARVSVLPWPKAVVTLSGVRWPLADSTLELGSEISISNQATGVVEASVASGTAWLFVEQDPLPTWRS